MRTQICEKADCEIYIGTLHTCATYVCRRAVTACLSIIAQSKVYYMEEKDINIALLIDADNISAKYISAVLSELSKYGKITIRRMYGDWSQDRLHSWLSKSSGFSLTPVMQPNNTPGKNASDIGLIIDAMDILYGGDVQGFCIVSSDGDFNKLATRLREAGKVVIGMGEKKTPESFRVSCERFIFLDVIESSEMEAEDTARKANKKSAAKKKSNSSASGKNSKKAGKSAAEAAVADTSVTYGNADTARSGMLTGSDEFLGYVASDAEDDSDGDGVTDLSTIEAAIVKMITENNAETGLGEIGSRLVKIFPDFDIRNYHYTKLSEFLKDFPSLAVNNRDNAVWVSLKSTPDNEVEKQILSIFKKHGTTDMNISALKNELDDLNPNLDATIRKSGVSRFSVYLNRKIPTVEVNGRHVTLKK